MEGVGGVGAESAGGGGGEEDEGAVTVGVSDPDEASCAWTLASDFDLEAVLFFFDFEPIVQSERNRGSGVERKEGDRKWRKRSKTIRQKTTGEGSFFFPLLLRQPLYLR